MSQMCLLLAIVSVAFPHLSRCNPMETDHIEDFTVRRAVVDFRLLCPYTRLCTIGVNTTVTLKVFYNKHEVVCCDYCSCDEDCDLNCCPDMLEEYLTEEEVQHHLETDYDECVHAQYKPYDESMPVNGRAYEMVNRCPQTYRNQAIANKCALPHVLYDFSEGASNFVPVTSNVSNVVYQNSFCAVCHNVSRAELVAWKASIECEYDGIAISNFIDLPNTLNSRDDCNILFKPTLPGTGCTPVIDKCNVTGKWGIFDPFLQTACLSYRSLYNGYRNIHCYLCNGNPSSDIVPICLEDNPQLTPMSFVALLDFSGTGTGEDHFAEVLPGRDCRNGSWYDPVKASCRPMLCPVGLYQSSTRCVPIYKRIEAQQVFEFDVTLVPYNTSINLTSRFPDDVSDAVVQYTRFICTNASSTDLMPHSVFGFVKLNHSVSETKTALMNQVEDVIEIQYLVYRIRVQNTRHTVIERVSETIEELVEFLKTGEIVQDYFMQYRTFDNMILSRTEISVSQFMDFNPTMSDLADINIPFWLHFGLDNAFNDSADGKAVLPLLPVNLDPLPWAPVLEIQIEASCAKVVLTRDEVSTINRTFIYVQMIDAYIHTDHVILGNNGQDYLLCVERYSALVNDFVNRRKKIHDEEVVYTPVVILTMVCISLSLVALVVTLSVYCHLPQLRTLPGKNIMSLVLFLMIFQSLTLLNTFVEVKVIWLCRTIGLILHFSLLSSFLWMFVCTAHMLKVITSLTDVGNRSNQTKLFLKYVIFSEILSSGIVLGTVFESMFRLGSSDIGYGGEMCYISSSSMILWTVVVPAGLVVLANLSMFLVLIIKMARMPDIRSSRSSERSNLIIFAKLSTITGLTWLFGFLQQFSGVEAFAYIFVVLNASQGIFIMLSFVANKRVYNAVQTSFVTSSTKQSQ